jgi:hypothetical protein
MYVCSMYVCMYIRGKCEEYRQNNTGQVQELLDNVLRVLNTVQTESEKSNKRLVARLQMEKEKNYI